MSIEGGNNPLTVAAELAKQDEADSARGPLINRARAIRQAIYDLPGEEAVDQYLLFWKSLPYDDRLTHYFAGSTPPPGVTNFDSAILERIEEFAKELGIEA
jgi:hypothetical protein